MKLLAKIVQSIAKEVGVKVHRFEGTGAGISRDLTKDELLYEIARLKTYTKRLKKSVLKRT